MKWEVADKCRIKAIKRVDEMKVGTQLEELYAVEEIKVAKRKSGRRRFRVVTIECDILTYRQCSRF